MSGLFPILPLGDTVEKGRVRGTVGRLQMIPIERLVVDSLYQRAISANSVRNVKRICREFDWAKFLPVIVTEAPDGRFAVVDGQHRATAALTLGIEAVPCYVLACSAAEAAGAFVAINGNVTPIKAIDIWFAELAAGEPRCLELQAVLAAAGVTVTHKKEGFLVGETQSVTVLRRALDLYGPAILTTILQCIVETYDGNPGMLIGAVINGIGMAIRSKPDLLASPTTLFAIFDHIALASVLYEARIEAARTGNSPQWIVTRVVNAAIRQHMEAPRAAA